MDQHDINTAIDALSDAEALFFIALFDPSNGVQKTVVSDRLVEVLESRGSKDTFTTSLSLAAYVVSDAVRQEVGALLFLPPAVTRPYLA